MLPLLIATPSPTIADSHQAAKKSPQPEQSTREALLESLLGDNPLAPNPDHNAAAPREGDKDKSSEPEPHETPAQETPHGPSAKKRRSEFAETTRRLLIELRAAKHTLAEGETGEKTQHAQQAALAATARLLELAKQRQQQAGAAGGGSPSGARASSGGRQGQGMQSQPSQGAQNSVAGQGGAGIAPGRARGKAIHSSEHGPGRGNPQDLYPTFRQTVIEHAWGHLPARMRQRLRNGGSDRPLPGYELLLNRYFQTLVRPDEASSDSSLSE